MSVIYSKIFQQKKRKKRQNVCMADREAQMGQIDHYTIR